MTTELLAEKHVAGDRAGYQPDFLPFAVPPPIAAADLAADLRDPLPYMHFSVALSRRRRLARWVAWNIDGASRYLDIPRDDQQFRPDPRIPESSQVLGEVYSGNRLDRGHLARRADLLWGSRVEAEQANFDSFYYPNITPQMDNFNQAERYGVWGRLEIALLEVVDRQRASVLAGPVLAADDPAYRGVQVPREFWKALAYVRDGVARVRIFLVTQSLVLGLAPDPLTPFEVYAISAAELASRTGLALAPAVLDKVVVGVPGAHQRARRFPVRAASRIRW